VDELIASGGTSPTPDRETADGHDAPSSPVPEGPVPIGSLIFADELPDGVVIADEVGRIIVFNRVAARLTGMDPVEVTGKFVFDVLPLCDDDGRDWWVYADPYHGLPTRTTACRPAPATRSARSTWRTAPRFSSRSATSVSAT
jgi:hypothetical protein